MEKADLLESLRTLAEAVELSCKADEPKDAGEIVSGILDETDINCAYETVRKMVNAITHHSEDAKKSLAKCLKEDGWTGDQCDGAVLNLKVADPGVPMGRVAQSLYEGLNVEQKELLLELLSEMVPFLLNDMDIHVNGLEEIVDDSTLEEWAEEHGWKHPDRDSIADFAEDMGSSEVRDFVVEYIQDNL